MSGNSAAKGGGGEPSMHEVNMQRESWCTVEMNSRQDWCRAERKHNKDAFKSSAFSEDQTPDSESRCTFKVNDKTHRERRHYPNKSYYSHLEI
ncbi:protein SPATA45 homolog [Asterias rubens]|uniref:protein SPATA45 homolog n=1 Tax=Asterias rubens TaxID=7604 RepID=UPI001455032E|nr:protein SPATA45 homolog [Asterias rubens]